MTTSSLPGANVQRDIRITYLNPPGHPRAIGGKIATVPFSTLTRFSTTAAKFFLSRPGAKSFGVRTDAPKVAVILVLDWMRNQASASPPAPMPCPDVFEEAVWACQICNFLRIPVALRGSEVRDGLEWYIKAAPFTMPEFAMVREVLGFEEGLVGLAVRETEKRFKEQGRRGLLDWEGIKQYCVENGVGIELGEGGDIEGKNQVVEDDDWEVGSTCGGDRVAAGTAEGAIVKALTW